MLTHRSGTEADLDLLTDWNHQLIRDERHRNDMTLPQLRERMRGWLKSGEYQAVIFSDGTENVAHALYKDDGQEVYLRQFFVRRDQRNKGHGRAAMDILLKIWPKKRLTVEVLCHNEIAIQLYRDLGYKNYSLKLEIMPE